MSLEELLGEVPAYAKDLKVNLSTLLRQTELTPRQAWGTAVACALTVGNSCLREAIDEAAEAELDANGMDAARTASAIMGMNNVYFRFLHLTPNPKYASIPARLRMNATRSHGVPPEEFELWCLAVSAINNCAACVASHEKVLREKGVTEETVLAAVRIASVIHALGPVLR